MKRILSLILTLSMLLSLAACGCQSRGRMLYTVTFDSNGGSAVPSQMVELRHAVQRPADPTKEDHTFAGWYSDVELTQLYDFDKPVERDITLYAKWEEGPVSGSGSSVDTYFISALTIEKDNNLATAVVSAPESCIFLVRFIEEDIYFSENYPNNKAYITSDSLYATCAVDAQTDMGKIGANIVGTLPQYYVAEAVLLDLDGNLLCNPASFIEHTARYEAFAKKTVHDFAEDDVVLQFEEAEDMNFGVLADDVITLRVTDLVIDEETDLHTLTGVNGTVKAGDKLFITDGTDTALIRVKTVTKNGDTVEIIPADAEDSEYGYALEDFYKFLKVDDRINSNIKTEEDSTNTEHMDSGLSTTAKLDVDISISQGLELKPIEINTENFKITGKVEGKLTADLVIVWDISLFGDDYFQFDFTKSLDINTNLSFRAKIDNSDVTEKLEREIELGDLSFPTKIPGVKVFAAVKGYLEWEISGGVELNGTFKSTQGFTYNTIDGRQTIEKKNTNWTLQCKGQAKIEFGPRFAIGVKCLDNVITAELVCFFGAKVEGERVIPMSQFGATEKHDCNLCFEGEVCLVLEVSAKLKYKITKHISGTPIDLTIVNIEWKLFDFYISLLNPESSAFGGNVKMGRGSCKNLSYKTKLLIVDENGKSYDGSICIYAHNKDKIITYADSGEVIYLPNGKYKAVAENVSVTFTVNGKVQTVKLVKGSGDTEVAPSDPSNPPKPSVPMNPDSGTYSEGLKYTLNEDGKSYSLIGIGDCSETDIVIHSTYNGLSVTTINDFAFYGCGSLTSVTIPNSVRTIGDNAFSDCYSLTGIWVDQNNQSYSSDQSGVLFDKNKTRLICAPGTISGSYSIPDSVMTIGDSAFSSCNSLTSVTIPNSVRTIGDNTFFGCDSLTGVTIPNSVATIGDNAFSHCYSLTSVTIGNSVTTIGDSAFSWCDSLTSVTIGNSVTTIGVSAFFGCYRLTSVTIPNSVTTIDDDAFSDCGSLTSVTIPNSVATIGDNAFSHCRSLTSVTIPNSVATIGENAFSNCYSLTNVTIPNSVRTIGDNAFSDCDSLIGIWVDKNNQSYSSDQSGVLFDKNKTRLICAPGTISGSYSIPDSVTTIDDDAFYGCGSLTSVTIPNSVTTIDDDAFNDCGSLTSVTIPNSVTTIGVSAFFGCYSLTSVTIPNSVTSIGSHAFAWGDSLNSIAYAGPVEKWKGIEFGFGWNDGVPATEVICSDGKVSLN